MCDLFWGNVPKRADKICSDLPKVTAYLSYGASFDAMLTVVSTI